MQQHDYSVSVSITAFDATRRRFSGDKFVKQAAIIRMEYSHLVACVHARRVAEERRPCAFLIIPPARNYEIRCAQFSTKLRCEHETREKPAKNQLPISRVLDEPYIEASRLCAAETTLANDRQL